MEPAMPTKRNPDLPEEVARQQLALAVETLSNIHYLIERSCEDPDAVKNFLEMAAPSMANLRELALQRDVFLKPHSAESKNPLPAAPEADRTDPLPLAAAGEENLPSPGAVSPKNRSEELEVD
jgi:hypothetical protein